MIDRLSHRYGLLPSEVIARASTFDLYTMDIGIRYEKIAEQKRNGTYKKPVEQLSQEQMKAMISKTRKKRE